MDFWQVQTVNSIIDQIPRTLKILTFMTQSIQFDNFIEQERLELSYPKLNIKVKFREYAPLCSTQTVILKQNITICAISTSNIAI